MQWRNLPSTGIRVELQSGSRTQQQEHWIRPLTVRLVNESSQRISELDGRVRVPAGILKHWSSNYVGEEVSDDPHYRCFRFDESDRGPVQPREARKLYSLEYCTQCALPDAGHVAAKPLLKQRSGSTAANIEMRRQFTNWQRCSREEPNPSTLRSFSDQGNCRLFLTKTH